MQNTFTLSTNTKLLICHVTYEKSEVICWETLLLLVDSVIYIVNAYFFFSNVIYANVA
jgi:hypothetical protein